MLYGARQSLGIALVTIAIATVIGGAVGAITGFVDAVLMRLADITMAFPSILLAMAVTAALSFLGLGALPPSPEWGAMITDGSAHFYQW